MAKRRKHKSTLAASRSQSTGQPTVQPIFEPAPITTAVKGKGKLRQALRRIADSAIDTALQYFWVGVAGIVITATAAIGLYVRSGEAAWLYPWLKYAVAYTAGLLTLILIILCLASIKKRRLKALERARNARFDSREKGYLDHIINQKRGFKDFNATLYKMSSEIAMIGKTTSRGTVKINLARRLLREKAAYLVFRISNNMARKLSKHARQLEGQLSSLQEITDLLVESTEGYLTWFTPDNEEQKATLLNDRKSLVTLLEVTGGSLVSMKAFRDSQVAIRGISQGLNTAVNRMVGVTEGIITFMRRAETHWQKMIQIIDSKQL